MRVAKYILPLFLLIVVFYLFVFNACAKVELPVIPQRPSLRELKDSLKEILVYEEKVRDRSKITHKKIKANEPK